MGNVRSEFLKPLEAVFTLPASKDLKGFIEAYENSLKTFSDETLRAAAERIIDNRESRTFPLPAECTRACRDVIEAASYRGRSKPDNGWEIRNAPLETRFPECSDKRRRQADEVFAQSRYASEAVKNDWSWTLWDWILMQQRDPDRYEIEKVRSKGLENSRKFWEMVGDPDNVSEETCMNSYMRSLISWRKKNSARLAGLIGVNRESQ